MGFIAETGMFFKKDLTYAFKDKVKVDKIDKMLRNLISRNIISRPIAMGHKTLKYLVHPDLLKRMKKTNKNLEYLGYLDESVLVYLVRTFHFLIKIIYNIAQTLKLIPPLVCVRLYYIQYIVVLLPMKYVRQAILRH